MVAAAITRSCISLSPVIPGHLTSIMDKLSAAGCKIIQKGRHILEVGVLLGSKLIFLVLKIRTLRDFVGFFFYRYLL